MAKKNNGYKIDFTKNVVYMNYKFASASMEFGTTEYKLIQEILKDFPQMKLVTRAGRTVKTCNANKRLTYANMERYIRVQEDAEKLMIAFEIAKEESQKQASPYAFVRNWFVNQFPDYQKCKVFDGEKTVVLTVAAPQEQEVA